MTAGPPPGYGYCDDPAYGPPAHDPELGTSPGAPVTVALGISGVVLLAAIVLSGLLVWPGYLVRMPARSAVDQARDGLTKITTGDCSDIDAYVTTATASDLEQACAEAPSTFADVSFTGFRTLQRSSTATELAFTFDADVRGLRRSVPGQVHLTLVDGVWKMDSIDLRTGSG